MKLHRQVLVSLALLTGLPVGSAMVGSHEGAAWAGNGQARFHMARHSAHPKRHAYHSAAVVLPEGSSAVTSVAAEIESDAGFEEVEFFESNGWLHGSASLKTLPKREAAFELYLYSDATGYVVRTVTGLVSPTGTITVDADRVAGGSDADCSLRTGCESSASESADVEVLAAELYPSSSGYDLALDLEGADVYGVAYATFVLTESDEVTTCDKVSRECTTSGSTTTTEAEVDWDELGSVWEADLALSHEGLIAFKVRTFDAEGEKIESSKAKLGVPWVGQGDGANSLATEEDPLTTVALHRRDGGSSFSNHAWGMAVDFYSYTVVSEGWSSTADLPIEAEIELTDGTTSTLPVQSYQRPPANNGRYWSVFCARKYSWSGFVPLSAKAKGAVFENIAFDDLGAPICADGICLLVTENDDDTCNITASAYGEDASSLPDSIDLVVTQLGEKGEALSSESLWIELDDEVVAVFEGDISFSGDPGGADLDGTVNLLGVADKNGKQETLAKGTFYSTIARDTDGDLALTGADKNHRYRGDLVVKLTAPTGKETVLRGRPPAAAVRFDRFGEGWARIAMVSRL